VGSEPPRALPTGIAEPARPPAAFGWASARTTGVLAGLACVDILLSVVYQWYFLRRIGPGLETDALYAGMMIPQLVLLVLTGSLIQVLVPLLAVQSDESYTQSVWTFMHVVTFGFGGLVLLAWITAGWWVAFTVPGFSIEGRQLTEHLVRIQLVGLVLSALSSVLWTAQQARRRFLWSAVSAALAGIVGLGFLLWGLSRFGVAAAAWVGVLRAGLLTALLLPGVGGYRRPRWRTDVTIEAWRRMRPLLSRSVYFKADIVVDRFLAGLAPVGALSLLTLARQLYTAGHQVVNRAVTAPAIPALAQLAARGDWTQFRAARRVRARWATGGAAAGVLLLLVFGHPVLSAFFAHSSFRPDQVDQMWGLLLVLSGVWVAGVTSQVLAGAFYAQGDTETPTRIGVVSFTVGVALKVLGFYVAGVWGIAAGASLHYLLMGSLLVRAGRRVPAAAALGVPEPPVGSSDPSSEGDFELPAVATERPSSR
jgi:putative peptidoglycan lipid II flippase